MATTEHWRKTIPFFVLPPSSRIHRGDSSDYLLGYPKARESACYFNAMPYEGFDLSRHSGMSSSRGEMFLPALDSEPNYPPPPPPPIAAAPMGNKRRRTAVVMEPGPLVSSSFTGSSAVPYQADRRTFPSHHHPYAGASSGPKVRPPNQKTNHHGKPSNVTRKVSFDPSHGCGSHVVGKPCARPEVARVVAAPQHMPRNSRGSSTSSSSTTRCESTSTTNPFSDDSGCPSEHDHAMFAYFQPPPSRYSPPRIFSSAAALSSSSSSGTRNNNEAVTSSDDNVAATAAVAAHSPIMNTSQMTTVSFSHDDFEPIPLDQQDNVFFGHSPRHHCNPSSKRHKKDDQGSMDRFALSSSSHHQSNTCQDFEESAAYCFYSQHHHYNNSYHCSNNNNYHIHKRGSCDDDECPSWELFADIENVPSDLRDDDVLTYLESSKEMTSSPATTTSSTTRNPRWDAMTNATYTNATPITTELSSPALFFRKPDKEPPKYGPYPIKSTVPPKLSFTSKTVAAKPTARTPSTTASTTTTSSSTPSVMKLVPFAMTQKKSRFKHYKAWGVLGTWGIRDVKSKLRELKLSTSGNKGKLLDRLRQAFAGECH